MPDKGKSFSYKQIIYTTVALYLVSGVGQSYVRTL